MARRYCRSCRPHTRRDTSDNRHTAKKLSSHRRARGRTVTPWQKAPAHPTVTLETLWQTGTGLNSLWTRIYAELDSLETCRDAQAQQSQADDTPQDSLPEPTLEVHDGTPPLLFGSLARGDLGAVGDIDLVAIYDDLGDYRERERCRSDLERRARKASGCPVDVIVTDAPEWAVRTQSVPCSLEALIAKDAITLAENPPCTSIDWGKEIGMPANPTAELSRWHQAKRCADRLPIGRCDDGCLRRHAAAATRTAVGKPPL